MPPKLIKSKSELISRAVRQLERYTDLTSLSEGSIARAIVEVITDEVGDLYSVLDFNFAQGMLEKARGTALDSLGTLLGVSRRRGDATEVSRGTCSFYFYLSSSTDHVPGTPDTTVAGIGLGSLTIPTGTLVTTSGDYVGRQLAYETTDTVYMQGSDAMSYCGLRPATADLLLNAGKGTLTVHNYDFCPQLYCYNPKSISALVDYETDDEYRFRIQNEVRHKSAANYWAVYMAALSVAGVKSVSIEELARGLGSVNVTISPHRAATNRGPLLVQVQQAVDEVRPVGINVIVGYPTFMGVDIVGQLVVKDTLVATKQQAVTIQAQDIIRNYLDSLGPGDPLVVNQLIGRVMNLTGNISDFRIRSLSVAGRYVPMTNYSPERGEQLYAGTIQIF